MDTSHAPEPFHGLLLRHRGRCGLIQRDLAARAGVSVRTVQDWEAGVKFPTPGRLRALIRALLEAGGLTTGQQTSEARELWTAAERQAPRMRAAFDERWFAGLLAADASRESASAEDALHTARAAELGTGTVEHAQDWGEAPDTSDFVGRAEELALLRGWVLNDRCRLVAVLGFGGIGKTILAARFAQNVAPDFERVYWRSLRNAPPVADWLGNAIAFLSDQKLVRPSSESERINALLQLIRARRCLLVLDNSEALFEPGQREGSYRAGMEGYGALLRAIGESSHQSCLVLTSREAPPELAVLAGGARELELHGLGEAEAQVLLVDEQLKGDPQTWVSLVDRFGGNGLALKIVGETIRQVYGGDIAAFLADAVETYGVVFGGIRRLLDAQAERLSPPERDVLRRLAVERESITLAELSLDIGPRIARGQIVEAIETLRRRSLVERGERRGSFTLQSMVLEYVTERLVETVVDEIDRGEAAVLVDQALIKAQAKEYVRTAQERLIGASILRRLNSQLGEPGTESRLRALIDGWRGRPVAEQGYGPGNVVNLLRLSRSDLRGTDLSRLALRQVYLQDTEMQDASLAGTHLSEAVVAEAFAYPTAVALSADGALLGAGTPTGEVRVWRVADRTPLLTVQGHSGAVWSVAFSDDGRVVASSGADGTVRVWEVHGGQPLATLRGHTGGVQGVAVNGNGRLVASGGEDGTVKLWSLAGMADRKWTCEIQDDARSGQLPSTLQGHTGAVWRVALSEDGRLVASGSLDGTVRLWDTTTGATRYTLQGHTAVVRGVALSGDGRLVASCGDDSTVKLWDAESGQLLASLQGHSGGVWGVALSRGGRLVASGGADGIVRLWESGSGQLLAALQGHSGLVITVALSGDGRLLASGANDGTVRLWEAGSGQILATLLGHTGVVWGVALSGDGRLMATGSDDGMVRLWQAGSGQPRTTLRAHPGGVWGVALSSDGRLVASGGADSIVRLWETGSGQLLSTLEGHLAPVWGVAVSGDGRLVASASWDGTAKVWEARSGQLRATLQGHTGVVWGVALSGDGRLVATSGDDETVRLWEADSGQLLATLLGHAGVVRGVALSEDGLLLASSSVNGSVRVWDAPSGRLLAALEGHTGVVWGVAVSGDGRFVATGSWDGPVRLWEARSGRLLATLQGHTGAVWCVALSKDGRLAASGGDDGMMRLWEARSGTCLQALRSDRHYQRLDITGLTGVTEAQRAVLLALGAVEDAPAYSGAKAAAT